MHYFSVLDPIHAQLVNLLVSNKHSQTLVMERWLAAVSHTYEPVGLLRKISSELQSRCNSLEMLVIRKRRPTFRACNAGNIEPAAAFCLPSSCIVLSIIWGTHVELIISCSATGWSLEVPLSPPACLCQEFMVSRCRGRLLIQQLLWGGACSWSDYQVRFNTSFTLDHNTRKEEQLFERNSRV